MQEFYLKSNRFFEVKDCWNYQNFGNDQRCVAGSSMAGENAQSMKRMSRVK